jgi:2-phosphosulfolactate phosphatase
LAGRTVIFTTSNGTQGLAAAQQAEEILTGGFVNAGAVAAYIRGRAPSRVSLVCMGSGGRSAVEDTLCALYLRAAIRGMPLDFESLREKIVASSAAAKFRTGDCADMPADDLALCLALDRFGFVLRAVPGPGSGMALERIAIAGFFQRPK